MGIIKFSELRIKLYCLLRASAIHSRHSLSLLICMPCQTKLSFTKIMTIFTFSCALCIAEGVIKQLFNIALFTYCSFGVSPACVFWQNVNHITPAHFVFLKCARTMANFWWCLILQAWHFKKGSGQVLSCCKPMELCRFTPSEYLSLTL